MTHRSKVVAIATAAAAASTGVVLHYSSAGGNSRSTVTGRRMAHTAPSISTSASALPPRSTTSNTHAIPCRDGTLIFPFGLPSRESLMKQLQTEVYDVLVIGGGCVGAGVALDATMRGLKVCLVEQDDFASGTSGRSTKLIHGGVRYLENAFWKLDIGEYRLVREALEERTHMLTAAPHLARALPILVPLEAYWQIPYFYLGGKVYDFVAGTDRQVPPSSYMGKEQALYAFPMLNPAKLKGAIVYYDGQMNDTRYALSIILTAIQGGAVCTNYCQVERLLPGIKGAVVKDMITQTQFEVHARTIINCTGPFSDAVREMSKTKKEDLIVPAGGVHVVLPDHFSPEHMGLIVPETSDGRVLFFLPWEGGTLCGTTDSKSHLTMLPRPTLDEIDFILSESSRYLNRKVSRKDVKSAWSGIRPLVRDLSKTNTSSISREHVVEVNAPNMVTIAGGKWTTYRRMAQDALDKLLESQPRLKAKAGPCLTATAKLIGADRAKIVCDGRFDIIQVTLREDYGFDRDVAAHLTRNYGTRSLQLAEMIRQGYHDRPKLLHPKRLCSKHPVLEVEVVFAVEQEYSLHAVDFLGRRSRLAFLDYESALEALPRVVEIMGDLLKWNKAKRTEEIKLAKEYLDTFKVPEETLQADE